MRSAVLAVLVVFAFTSFESFASAKSGARLYYGGGKHTRSHHGTFMGGVGLPIAGADIETSRAGIATESIVSDLAEP